MAVYTEISKSELEQFLMHYSVGTLVSFKGIAEGVENSNYLLVTTTGTYILTLYEKRVNAEDLPFYLGLMKHLAARQVPCPVPIVAKDGAMLQQLKGRPAAMVSFLEGKSTKNIKNHHLEALGAAMAKMHLAAEGFSLTCANKFSLPSWKSLFQSVSSRADEVKTGLAAEITEHLTFLETHWPSHLPAGVIHADVFPDNVFFEKDSLTGIIDFYFACNDFLAYDLAICLNAWCFENHAELNVTKAKLLITSYHAVRPLSSKELATLPVLASGAAMRFLLTRLYDWLNRVEGAMVTPKDPLEYLKKLRFHQGVPGPEAYGIYHDLAASC